MNKEYWEQMRPAAPERLDRPGTYMIACKPTGECYVGATTRTIRRRIAEHFNTLEQRAHSCWRLQERYDIYGPDEFVVMVSQCDEAEAPEFYWMESALKAGKLLNTRHAGINLKRMRREAFGH